MEEAGLPCSLCSGCSADAITAAKFRKLCTESNGQWHRAANSFTVDHADPQDKAYYFFYNPDCETLVRDQIRRVSSAEEALQRLSETIEVRNKKREKRLSVKHAAPGQCPECKRQFASSYHFNEHLKKTSRRVCYHCGEIVERDILAQHLRESHDTELLCCSVCYKLFDGEEKLVRHVAAAHGPNSHECQHCGQSFGSGRALRAHVFTHTLFHCGVCSSTFESRKCYKYHRLLCRGEAKSEPNETYVCHDCGRTYDKKASLRIHISQKHLHVLPYVCVKCGKRTSTLAHLKSHQNVHLSERKTLSCPECGVQLRTELGMVLHRRIHTGEKPFVCTQCGDRFLSASRRLDHVKRRHMLPKDAPHACPSCPARFVRPFELRKHVASVHGGKQQGYDGKMPVALLEERLCPSGICTPCYTAAVEAYEWRLVVTRSAAAWSETISALESLPPAVDPKTSSLSVVIQGDEINLFHNYNTDTQTALRRLKARLSKPRASERKPRVNRNGPNSVCDDCGKTFPSPHYLNIHLQNSAQKEACLVCGLITIRGQPLRDHLHTVHNQRFYVCPECPLLLRSEAEVQKHVKKAHRAGVHTCRDCGRTFPRASSFEAHMQMHAVRTCRVCSAQFANRACYREHRAQCEPDAKPNKGLVRRDQRSNIRDPAVYICDHCGKTYLSRPQLKNHILWIHMNVRPHQCQWCGKRFYTSARLLEHSVVHTRERNFACDICGAKLVTKMALVYHTRRHTGEKPYECADCGEKFLSASRRSEHRKRRHGKGAMFHCTLCTNYFVRGHELRKHMEKVHRKDTATSVAPKIEAIEETLHKDHSDKITIMF